jgi:abortive infection alpha-like protein
MTDRHLELVATEEVEGSASWSLRSAAPGLVRFAATASVRTTGWTVGTSLRTGTRITRAIVSGEAPAAVAELALTELRKTALGVLGIADARESDPVPEIGTPGSLRARGAELLRRSADVHVEEETHPAYAHILDELTPDEARILRCLALEGSQPTVDVRSGPLPVGSQLIAPGLSMIGAHAGCRHVDRVPQYLNNLRRLGLIVISPEPVENPLRYQVLEAQPDVAAAMREAGLARTVRRSVHLTPFGEDFVEMCLPLSDGAVPAPSVS